MWRAMLVGAMLQLAATTTVHAQHVHIRLTSGATFSYPIEEIRGISYSDGMMRFDRYDGSDLSWSISDVAHYHFFQRADGFDESVLAIDGVHIVKYPEPGAGAVDFDLINRSRARMREDDWSGAAVLLEQLVETYPENEYGFLLRGYARGLGGDFEAAIADYDHALALNPVYFYAFFYRGIARAELGDIEAALADYSTAIENDPFNPRGYVQRGWTHYFVAGDRHAALADLDRALELDAENPDAYNDRGVVKAESSDYVGAIEDYHAALAISPDHPFALSNLGNIAMSLANFSQERALEILTTYFDFDGVVEIDPAAGNALGNPALHAIVQRTAIRLYDAAIASDADYATAYGNKALALMYLGSIDEACELWQTALELGDAAAAGYLRGICERREP
jgi:tetratricopeptide (TPR) repeat protein